MRVWVRQIVGVRQRLRAGRPDLGGANRQSVVLTDGSRI